MAYICQFIYYLQISPHEFEQKVQEYDFGYNTYIQTHRLLVFMVASSIHRTSDPNQKEMLGILSLHAISLVLALDKGMYQDERFIVCKTESKRARYVEGQGKYLLVKSGFEISILGLDLLGFWHKLIKGTHP